MTVYIINQLGSNLWKIGYTTYDAKDRLKQLQTGNPNALVIYTQFEGTINDERKLHNEFAAYRIGGGGNEWFDVDRDIVDNAITKLGYYTPKYTAPQNPKYRSGKLCQQCGKQKRLDCFSFISRSDPNQWCTECIYCYNIRNFAISYEISRSENELVVYFAGWRSNEKMCCNCMAIKPIDEYEIWDERGADEDGRARCCKKCFNELRDYAKKRSIEKYTKAKMDYVKAEVNKNISTLVSQNGAMAYQQEVLQGGM